MATVSITITAVEATRFQTAVGKVTGLPGAATAEQARAYLIKMMKDFVLQTEREVYLQAHSADSFDPT